MADAGPVWVVLLFFVVPGAVMAAAWGSDHAREPIPTEIEPPPGGGPEGPAPPSSAEPQSSTDT